MQINGETFLHHDINAARQTLGSDDLLLLITPCVHSNICRWTQEYFFCFRFQLHNNNNHYNNNQETQQLVGRET